MANADNKQIMDAYGIKNTKQRHLVLNVLQSAKVPMTAEQIYFEVYAVDATISLSTIYRTLDMFAEKGVLAKSKFADENKTMFSLNSGGHKHHLVCIGCKKITVTYDCPMTKFEKDMENQNQFQVTGHNLEIYGYCAECRHDKKDHQGQNGL